MPPRRSHGPLTRSSRSTPAETSVVVVADGPSDVQAAALDASPPPTDRVEVVWTRERLGDAATANIGIRRARGPIVILLDPDDSSRSATSCRRSSPPSTTRVWRSRARGGRRHPTCDGSRPRPPGEVDAVDDACQAFRRTDGATRGPLDERFRSIGPSWPPGGASSCATKARKRRRAAHLRSRTCRSSATTRTRTRPGTAPTARTPRPRPGGATRSLSDHRSVRLATGPCSSRAESGRRPYTRDDASLGLDRVAADRVVVVGSLHGAGRRLDAGRAHPHRNSDHARSGRSRAMPGARPSRPSCSNRSRRSMPTDRPVPPSRSRGRSWTAASGSSSTCGPD